MKPAVPSPFLLLCTGLLLSLSGLAQLHGDYTIDPSGSGSTNFTSFNTAVTALVNQGVDSAVTFYVKEGTYNEQLTIDSIPGTSQSNTVFFTSDSTNTSEVHLEYTSTCNANWVVNISGADWITFDQMVLNSNGSFPCHGVLLIEDHSRHITVQHSTISGPIGNNYAPQSSLVASDGDAFDDVTLLGNTFTGAGYAVRLFAPSGGAHPNNLTIQGNQFRNQYMSAIRVYHCDGIQIMENLITADSVLVDISIALYLFDCIGIDVIGNTIYANANMGYERAIFLWYCIGLSQGEQYHWIANNCIRGGNDSCTMIRAPLLLRACGFFDIVHNSIRLQTSSLNNYGLSVYGSNMRAFNNVIHIPSGRAISSGGNFSLIESDYNLIYSGSAHAFSWNGNTMNTFESWQNNTGLDAHSYWGEANFIPGTICQTCNDTMDNGGIPIPAITEDINGEIRSAISPDIGAIEFVSGATFSLGPDTVRCADSVILDAAGSSSVSWTVNGSAVNASTVLLQPNCEPETYTVAASVQTAYCGAGSDTAVITVVPSPNLPSDVHLCAGQSATIESCGGDSAFYWWLDSASTGKTITVDEAGMYSVAKTELGCTESDTVWVTQSDSLNIGDQELCQDELPLTLNAAIANGLSYQWSGGSSNNDPVNTFTQDGIYSITATDSFGCLDTETFEIVVVDTPTAVIGQASSGLTYFFDASSSLNITSNTTFFWEFDATASIQTSNSMQVTVTYPWPTSGQSAQHVVKLVVDNGCGVDTAVNKVWVYIGIEDVQSTGFSIFPNPLKDQASFVCDDCTGGYIFRLMDAAGRLCRTPERITSGQFQFHRKDLAPGVYLYELESEDFLERGKLVIR